MDREQYKNEQTTTSASKGAAPGLSEQQMQASLKTPQNCYGHSFKQQQNFGGTLKNQDPESGEDILEDHAESNLEEPYGAMDSQIVAPSHNRQETCDLVRFQGHTDESQEYQQHNRICSNININLAKLENQLNEACTNYQQNKFEILNKLYSPQSQPKCPKKISPVDFQVQPSTTTSKTAQFSFTAMAPLQQPSKPSKQACDLPLKNDRVGGETEARLKSNLTKTPQA